MKKVLCLFGAFMIFSKFFCVQAQQYGATGSSYWYYYSVYNENQLKDKNKKNQLKQKEIIDPGHSHVNTLCKYDTAGRVISYRNRKKEIRIGYVKDDMKGSQAYYKNGKLVERDSFSWEGKKLIEDDGFDNKNKIVKRIKYKYDSTYVTENVYEKLKKGKFSEYRKSIIEYYPDYSYKKITYYKNGKPCYYTVFDCNPYGQNHKVEKDSAYNCVKYDVDSLGNKIKITLTNNKGSSWKRVDYYNTKDEVTAQKTYDVKNKGKEKLLWVYYYNPGLVFTKFISYKRSKEYYRTENEYDDQNNCTGWAKYIHGKLKERNQNLFNERGLLFKTEEYNKKNKKKKEITYRYEYY